MRVFGEILNYPPGSKFNSRREVADAGIHRPLQAGICGGANEGAESIVLSGGYEDDYDDGDTIIYTGHGGRDPNTGKQVRNQEFKEGNKALALNRALDLPLRVVRSIPGGYEYAGLYRVVEFWPKVGKSGFMVWQYHLERIHNQELRVEEPHAPYFKKAGTKQRVQTTVLRVVRDTQLSREIKELYQYECQVCKTALKVSTGPYVEAAHIKPLGRPHDGPDDASNIICLCPNHHIMLDMYGMAINNDLSIIGLPQTKLYLHPHHEINTEYTDYHKGIYKLANQ